MREVRQQEREGESEGRGKEGDYEGVSEGCGEDGSEAQGKGVRGARGGSRGTYLQRRRRVLRGCGSGDCFVIRRPHWNPWLATEIILGLK